MSIGYRCVARANVPAYVCMLLFVLGGRLGSWQT